MWPMFQLRCASKSLTAMRLIRILSWIREQTSVRWKCNDWYLATQNCLLMHLQSQQHMNIHWATVTQQHSTECDLLLHFIRLIVPLHGTADSSNSWFRTQWTNANTSRDHRQSPAEGKRVCVCVCVSLTDPLSFAMCKTNTRINFIC